MTPRIWVGHGRLYVQWGETGAVVELADDGSVGYRFTVPASAQQIFWTRREHDPVLAAVPHGRRSPQVAPDPDFLEIDEESA